MTPTSDTKLGSSASDWTREASWTCEMDRGLGCLTARTVEAGVTQTGRYRQTLTSAVGPFRGKEMYVCIVLKELEGAKKD